MLDVLNPPCVPVFPRFALRVRSPRRRDSRTLDFIMHERYRLRVIVERVSSSLAWVVLPVRAFASARLLSCGAAWLLPC